MEKGGGQPEQEESEVSEAAGCSETLLQVNDVDPPVVFLCGRCQVALGDSLAWRGNDEEDDMIFLKSVSENVVVAKEQDISMAPKEFGCTTVALSCSGCSLKLGKIYKCTPKRLDCRRGLFCFDVSAIESYILGSGQNNALSEDRKLLTFETCASVEEEVEKGGRLFSVAKTPVKMETQPLSVGGKSS
uniref:Protein Mis18-alpha n=1 Tax=Latimeria chalumnae TaxID=7897 RepID=H3BCM9_LATCH